MQIFVHTLTGLALAEDIDDQTTIQGLMTQAGFDDSTAWLQDADDPLNATDLVATVAADKAHIHVSRCRRVDVTVNFAGKSKEHRFAPGATIQAVLRWAVSTNGFDLPTKERPKHELGVCGTGVIADRNEHVGTLATDCALCLDLAPKDRFQG